MWLGQVHRTDLLDSLQIHLMNLRVGMPKLGRTGRLGVGQPSIPMGLMPQLLRSPLELVLPMAMMLIESVVDWMAEKKWERPMDLLLEHQMDLLIEFGFEHRYRPMD